MKLTAWARCARRRYAPPSDATMTTPTSSWSSSSSSSSTVAARSAAAPSGVAAAASAPAWGARCRAAGSSSAGSWCATGRAAVSRVTWLLGKKVIWAASDTQHFLTTRSTGDPEEFNRLISEATLSLVASNLPSTLVTRVVFEAGFWSKNKLKLW